MRLLRNLFGIGKLELNHLYTEPPSNGNGGRDEGWFCREHAFHTYFVARLLHVRCSIERGHFAVLLPEGGRLSSFDTDGDHAWCSLGETRPVDLSIGFSHYPEYPQLDSAVVGQVQNGDFAIEYTTDTDAFRGRLQAHRKNAKLCYLALPFSQPDDDSLLGQPEKFFYPSDENGWLTRYGPDLFSKITLHIFKVIRGDIPPMFRNGDPRESLRHIRARYPAARAKIRRFLSETSSHGNWSLT